MPATYTDSIDGLTTSVAEKAPVVVATNGAITLSGEQTVNGVACVEGDRVLVKDQDDSTTNGIYVCSDSAWSRALDFNGNRDVVKGTSVRVAGPSVSTGSLYIVTTENPIVIGTSAIVFVQKPEGTSDSTQFVSMEDLRVSTTDQDYVETLAFYASGTTGAAKLYRDGTGTPTGSGAAVIAAALAAGTFCNAAGVCYKLRTDQEINAYQFGVVGGATAGDGDFLNIITQSASRWAVKVYGDTYALGATPLDFESPVWLMGQANIDTSTGGTASNSKVIFTSTSATYAVRFGDGSATTGRGARMSGIEIGGGGTAANGILINSNSGSTSAIVLDDVIVNDFTTSGIVAGPYSFICELNRVLVKNCASYGYDLQQGCNGWVFNNCFGNTNGYHGRIGSGAGTAQNGITFFGGNFEAATSGGWLIQAPTLQVGFFGTRFEGNTGYNIKASGVSLTINNVSMDGGGNAIWASGTCYLYVDDVVFTGTNTRDIYIEHTSTQYGKIGPCRHSATNGTAVITDNSVGGHWIVHNTNANTITVRCPTESHSGTVTVEDLVVTDTAKVNGFAGTATLGVQGESASTRILDLSTSAGTSAVYSCGGNATMTSGENAAASTLYLRRDNATSRSINASGTINASGADYAEYRQVVGRLWGKVPAGTVLGYDKDGLLTDRYDDVTGRFVIKSTAPCIVGNDVWGGVEKLGMNQRSKASDIEAAHETERKKWDRVSLCGITPANFDATKADVGKYCVPVRASNGGISVSLVDSQSITLPAYIASIGTVESIGADGRPVVNVKSN